jgi:hypothetical protein
MPLLTCDLPHFSTDMPFRRQPGFLDLIVSAYVHSPIADTAGAGMADGSAEPGMPTVPARLA